MLTRNTFATPHTAVKGKDRKVYTKADILNLISSDTASLSQIGLFFVRFLRIAFELFLGCSYVWILLGEPCTGVFSRSIRHHPLICAGPSGFYGLATLILTLPPAYLVTKLQYKLFEKRLAISDEKLSLMQEAIQAISMIKMMAAERFWFTRIREVREREFRKLVHARLLGAISGLL